MKDVRRQVKNLRTVVVPYKVIRIKDKITKTIPAIKKLMFFFDLKILFKLFKSPLCALKLSGLLINPFSLPIFKKNFSSLNIYFF